MKNVLTLILLLVAVSSVSAQQAAVEQFINQVHQTVVPPAFSYYNLADSSSVIRFDSYEFGASEQKEIRENYPDFPTSFFLRQATNAPRISWRKYRLANARVYDQAVLPGIPVDFVLYKQVPFKIAKSKLDSLNQQKATFEILVPAKASWTNKHFRKAAKKVEAAYVNGLKPEERVGYYFSNPLFSPDGRYAVATLNQSGRGATYIFKKEGDKWRQIFVFNRWVS